MSPTGLNPSGAAGAMQIESGVQAAVHPDKHTKVDANMGDPSEECPETLAPSQQLSSKYKTTLEWEG